MDYFNLFILIILLTLSTSCKSDKVKPVRNIDAKTEKTLQTRETDTGSTPPTATANDTVTDKSINQPMQDVFTDIRVVREINHDTAAYTQGLIYYKGDLYESTGQYGESTLRKLNPKTGKILEKIPLESKYFAEGIAIFKNSIYQLTWRAGTGFIYDLMTMRQTGTFTYYGEGWGITSDGKNLIMSDGTNALRFLDPKTMQVVKTIFVLDRNSYPLYYLNELEYINNEIWANVYMSNNIVRINPEDGHLISTIDLSFLKNKITITPSTDVLNGIAYDKKNDEYYFTGKNWNKIFVLKMK